MFKGSGCDIVPVIVCNCKPLIFICGIGRVGRVLHFKCIGEGIWRSDLQFFSPPVSLSMLLASFLASAKESVTQVDKQLIVAFYKGSLEAMFFLLWL